MVAVFHGGKTMMRCLLCFSMILWCAAALAMGDSAEGGKPSASGNFDEVIGDLVSQLDKDPNSARDAAQKLSNFGKRAVPVLSELLHANFKKKDGKSQIIYTTVWSLSRIKNGDAARALLPVLEDEKSAPELRSVIVEAVGMELCDEGITLMQTIAANEENPELRKKILQQLSTMPTAWAKSEKLFVDALSSPDADVRTIAAKQCYFCRIYRTAEPKLIELVENDTEELVRVNSLLALSRMRVQLAVPAMVRILANDGTPEKIRAQVLKAVQVITGTPFKDRAAVDAWWQRAGKAEFTKLEEAKKQMDEAAKKALEGKDPNAPVPAATTTAENPNAPAPGPAAPANPATPARPDATTAKDEPKPNAPVPAGQRKPLPADNATIDGLMPGEISR
jgi:HEAT repeat protein